MLPGYPTLRTLGVTAALKMAAVEVLGQPSKKESLILTVKVSIIFGPPQLLRNCLRDGDIRSCTALPVRSSAAVVVMAQRSCLAILV